MSLSSIFYGNVNVLPAFDTSSGGFGDLNVSGNTLLAGASTSITGILNTLGATSLSSTLTVGGTSTFNAPATFNQLATFVNGIVISDVTDSTNSNTGAFQVKGGLSVALSSYIGGLLDVTGATRLRNTLQVDGATTINNTVLVTNTVDALSATTGSIRTAGGITAAGNIRSTVGNLFLAEQLTLRVDGANGNTYLNSPGNQLYINNAGAYNVLVNQGSTANFTVANAVNINTTGLKVTTNTDSASLTTGAFQVVGGAAIGMTLNVGGNLNVPIGQTTTSGRVLVINTAQSTSTTSGSLQVSGGAGIVANAYIGGFLDVASTAATFSSIGNLRLLSASNGSNWIQSGDLARTGGNWTPLKFSPLGSQVSIMTVRNDGLTIDSTTASTSATSGSLVVAGGAGIGGNVNITGTTNFTGVVNHASGVWMNGNVLSLGTFNDQTSGLVYSNTASAGGPYLYGDLGGSLGTSSGVSKTALRWDANQNVYIRGATDTTSSTTGAFTVVGGAGIAKSLWVGVSSHVQNGSWTSTGDDVYLNANNANINLRNTPGSLSGEFESSPTFFNFRTLAGTGETPISPYRTFSIDKTTGHVLVLNTDNATANLTGSFQVSGGSSISKSLWVGENAQVQGDLIVNGSISTTGANPVNFSNTTNSESTSTGAVIVGGGVGIGLNLYVGGLSRLTDTTNSSSPSTGSLVVSGGAGFANNIFVGGNGSIAGDLTVAGNITSTAGSVVFANTTASTSTTTGAVIVGGGVGIGGNTYTGGIANFVNTAATTSVTTGSVVVAGGVGITGGITLGGQQYITNNTNSTSTITGSFITSGGVGIAQNLNVGANTRLDGTLTVVGQISSIGGLMTISNTTDATAPTGGALTIAGGVGIGKRLHVGSTDNATSITTGSTVIYGGAGIAGDVYTGGNMYLMNTVPRVIFNPSSFAPPSYVTRSVGTKILLNATGGATTADYAIGLGTSSLWNSVPANAETNFFRWFGGTTAAMVLDGVGTLSLNGTLDASAATGSGTLRVAGGAGIARNLYIGTSLNVGTTSYFTGAIQANTDITVAGILNVTNGTNSTAPTNGAIITAGGLGVAQSANIGQNLTVTGNETITGNSTTVGLFKVNNVLESTNSTNGSGVFSGGVGIAKNLNVGGALVVGGSTTINGNLTVNGSRTEVKTTVITLQDNVILVNNGPSGSASSGLGMKRYQLANDFGAGDLVNNETPEHSGTAQAGATTTTFVMDTGASSLSGHYNGGWLLITAGTGTGQVRRINTYVGSTRTATIYTSADQATLASSPVEGMDWSTVPDATSTFEVYTSQYVVMVHDEMTKELQFGTTAVNPVSDAVVNVRNYITMRAGTLRLDKRAYVDQIDEFHTDAGVTVESVNIKDGNLTGVQSINGNLVDITQTVSLVDNDSSVTVPIPGTGTSGSYTFYVEDMNNTGAYTVIVAAGNNARGGNVQRAVSVPGANSEALTVSWLPGGQPSLKFLTLPTTQTGATYTYNVKVVSV